jgi:hypothetical protein
MPKEIEFESGGNAYKLVLDLNAQALFEEMTEKNFYQVSSDRKYVATAAENRIIFYTMLKRYQPEITLEEAGALVGSLYEVPAIREAMLRSQPESTGEGEPGEVPPPEPTG